MTFAIRLASSQLSCFPQLLLSPYSSGSTARQQEEATEKQAQSRAVHPFDSVGHSEKGLAGDWTGPEATEVLKLSAEPPKIRGYSSQFDRGY